MQLHTTASWRVREDRLAAVLWIAFFWIFTALGFGFDLNNYFHEVPPVPLVVHVHAVITTFWLLLLTALVALVELDHVKLHRSLGWFGAGLTVLMVILCFVAQISWHAVNLHTPDALPPQFLSIAYSSPICVLALVTWGILLRGNLAAHRRVMMLAAASITDPGFSRLMGMLHFRHHGWLGTFLFYDGANLLLIALMFAWDWKKGRVMQQFVQGATFITVVELAASWLYCNPAWSAISRGWVEGWARLMYPSQPL